MNFLPRRYTEPKWQAYITEPDKKFYFDSGLVISSLYELKQALVNLSDHDLSPYLGDDHHIANWVEFVIGEPQLASQLRKNHHRWGMIVALERGCMRMLNLPPHVAQYWLRSVQLPFTFSDGKIVNSLTELSTAVSSLEDEVIEFHLDREPNDISLWVSDIIGDYELAELIEESSHRQQMLQFIEDHLVKLNDAADN